MNAKTADPFVCLFGSALRPVNIAGLSKRTGISRQTLYEYKANPYKIPLERLILMVRELELTDAEIVELIRGKK